MSASEPATEPARRSSCSTCKAVFRGDFRRCSNCGTPLLIGGPDPLVGTVLAERYQIEEVLGDGGLGRVYRARHVRMSRRYAIKVPFGDVGYDRKSRARLSNEAEAASRLDHPNVIGIVDVGETAEGLFYMAMDLAEGQALADVLDDGALTIDDTLEYLIQLCAGLAHAHDRGLIHRDLKPDNIVLSVTSDGQTLVQIIDFGLALIADNEGSRLTTEGLVVGTPYYMAPEQSTDEPLDLRTDLFALGIILYEMLAGSLPFDGGPTAVARQNLAIELPTVLERSGRSVDPLLDGMIGWLTRKRAEDRPGNARLVAEFAKLLRSGDRHRARELLPESLRPAIAATVAGHAAADYGSFATAPTMATPVPGASAMVDESAELRAAVPASAIDLVPNARDIKTDTLTPMSSPSLRNPLQRYGLVALIGLGLGTLITLAIRIRSGGGRDGAALVSDARVTPIAVVSDGGVTDAVDAAEAVAVVIDAAAAPAVAARGGDTVVVRERIDAGPRALPPPTRVDARASDVGSVVIRPPPATIDAGVPDVVKPPPGRSLKGLYGEVAAALDDAVTRYGAARTAGLRKRFDDIAPYSAAVRNDGMRAEATRQLEALARDIKRL